VRKSKPAKLHLQFCGQPGPQAANLPSANSLPAAQGIEAEILLAQPKDWSGKPGFLREAQKMRPKIPAL
jgi:hypothetical protein